MKITVAGGGISGLTAAFHILGLAKKHKRNINLSLLEAGSRLGGVISTVSYDGFTIEEGPDSVLTKDHSVIELSQKLGIEDEIIRTRDENSKVYIFHKGRLIPLPDGFYLMAPTDIVSFLKSPLFSLWGKLRVAMEMIIPGKSGESDESLDSFVTRRFGREALERVVQPLIGGIYTADPSRLSLKATMPQFIEMERKYGSVIRGLRKNMSESGFRKTGESGARYSMFVSFREGMKTLVDALESSLPDETVRLDSKLLKANTNGDKWRLLLSDGSTDESDGLVLALPAHVSSGILDDTDKELSTCLSEIEYSSSCVVNLVYRKEDLPGMPKAFGVLIPEIEKRDVIAFSFLSEKLENRAPSDHVIIRCFTTLGAGKKVNEQVEAEIVGTCIGESESILGATGKPVHHTFRKYEKALPLYSVGHMERVKNIEEQVNSYKGLALSGNAYSGVGIPHCVNEAVKSAEKVFFDLFARPR